MEFQVVLSSLQSQFAGKLVLYVSDIATILGKSPKAVQNLIDSKKLPFKVKLVGGLRCVDIFQVAQWFVTDAAMAEEVSSNERSKARTGQPKSALVQTNQTPTESVPIASSKASELEESQFGPMALMILKNRKAQAIGMQRRAFELCDLDEKAFMFELMEHLFFGAAPDLPSYTLTFKKLAPRHFKVKTQVLIKVFDNESDALDFLVDKLVVMRFVKSLHIFDLKLESESNLLFHAVASQFDKVSIIKCEVELSLPGI